MAPLTTTSFVLRRLADDWKLLAAIFAGVTIAATLLAGAPIYIATLERQSVHTAIDRADQSFLNIYGVAPYVTLSRDSLDSTERVFRQAIADNVQGIYRGHERFLKTATFLVGTERNPLTRPDQDPDEAGRVSRGYFQRITNLEKHVTFTEGRAASGEIAWEGGAPTIEAVVGGGTSRVFDVRPGDVVTFAPSLTHPARTTVKIVGILEPTDPSEEYWQQNPNLFIEPAPLDEIPDIGVEIDPEEPPMAVFVTRDTLIDGVGATYPGSLVTSNWFVFVDKEGLKLWNNADMRARVKRLESDVSVAMQGSAVFTGIEAMLNRLDRRSFYTSAPLLVLVVVMAVTALYYILMMVSYLVAGRESDVALLRSRGVSSWHLARIYALEGAAIALIGAAIAPFLALGGIALAGKLSYFRDITLGGFLPVSLDWRAFAVSGAVGLVCLALYVIPGVVGARTGLIVRKLNSSRPPSTPFFHRYYIDVGLMAVGGLIFWELSSRGQIISGGLFEGARVNEALLFAPVVLLTVAALVFMRFFPILVRYLSGDSPAAAHILAGVTYAAILSLSASGAVGSEEGLGWLARTAHLGAITALYVGTWRARRAYFTAVGLALQAALTALYLYVEIPARGDALYMPTLALAALVPAQLLFFALRRLARSYPVWASMAIWRMSRNPLQYSWLILLIVMVTGLGALATTVGGTLDRSYEERALYEVASDIRVTGIPTHFARGNEELKERYLEMPGVTALSLALRGEGSVGATYSGNSFDIFAVESDEFPYISWYRDDFSERPLPQVMSLLKTGASLPPINLPEGADSLRVWARPMGEYPNVFLWMALRDNRGYIDTITFGPLIGEEWTLMESAVPSQLEDPISLVSVQIYEPSFGPAGTAGALLLDDIQAVVRGDRGATETEVLDDFEGENKWTPLSTSMISRDEIGQTSRDARNGARAGAFVFGKDTDQGIRGFYRSPSGGPVPVVASESFALRTGARVGDSLIVNVFGRLIPVRMMDTVDYFPTMDPDGNGFLVADLDNLLRHLNILSPVGAINPNELLLARVPGDDDQVYRLARSLAPRLDMVHDRTALLEEIRLDPMITAGWRAMILVAMGVIAFTATLGYATYLMSFAGRSRAEMGFLQALGLRSRQMTWLLGAEHLVTAALGLALGTAAGFAMSSIMVSAVAVTETGNPVVPPFVLTTDWAFMGAVYAMLAVIFVGALLWLSRSVSRVRMRELSRLEVE